MAAGNVRVTRYVLVIVFILLIIYLMSASSIPKPPLPNNADFVRWKGRKHASQATVTSPSLHDEQVPSSHSAKQEQVFASQLAKQDSELGSQASLMHGSDSLSGSSSSSILSDSISSTSRTSRASDRDAKPTISATVPFPDRVIPPEGKMNATFVTLARNTDLWDIVESIRQVEDRFNRHYHYDWVFLNDDDFQEEFKKVTTALISGKTKYGKIPKEHWSFPDFIDQDKAKKVREDMADRKIIYGDSVSYRHMCRFESGFFFQQPLMLEYEWYWRVEPSVKLFCDIGYDPFRFMAENKKKYSFVISLYEYVETIPTIWDSAKKFMTNYPQHIAKDNGMKWLSDDAGDSYNHCHFWSNFEIGNLNWLRSQAYTDFFETLDRDGGFFYERWGDAPVHSIAAGLLLNKDEVHFFEDIGYWHVPFTHCPTNEKQRLDLKCSCNPSDNFDWKGYSCTKKWFEVNNMKKPEGYKDQED